MINLLQLREKEIFEALKKLIEIKAQRGYKETTGVVEGRLETAAKE